MRSFEAELQDLCDTLSPKLPRAHEAMEYVRHGEHGLALEMLSDWCADGEPRVVLSAAELTRFMQLGESIGSRRSWADLLPLVELSEVGALPIACATNAQAYVDQESRTNPTRRAWLARVQLVIHTRLRVC